MFLIIEFIVVGITGFCVGRFIKKDKEEQRLENAISVANKNFSMFSLMNRWVQNKSRKKEISNYLMDKGINTVAIYGMNYIGKTLYMDLKNTSVKVKYAIDRNAECMYAECEIFNLQEELSKVDAIIVTPLVGFDEIKETIKKKMECKIISMEEIVYKL